MSERGIEALCARVDAILPGGRVVGGVVRGARVVLDVEFEQPPSKRQSYGAFCAVCAELGLRYEEVRWVKWESGCVTLILPVFVLAGV